VRRALAAAAAALALLAGSQARAAEVPIPPSPTRWVTDNAAFLSQAEREQLDDRLQKFEKQSGHQVIVWIGQTTGDTPLEDWTVRAFAKWKIGRKGLDDGAVLFVFATDHKLRIEVGYGLEGLLTDARSSEIIRNTIVPKIRSGDNDGAIDAGVSEMIAAIGGQPGSSSMSDESKKMSIYAVLFLSFVIFGIAIIIVRNPGVAGMVLYTLATNRGGGYGGFGGGGGGGGGFSGGGGSSGGGGASGGW
jgi:uncharacterized protein